MNLLNLFKQLFKQEPTRLTTPSMTADEFYARMGSVGVSPDYMQMFQNAMEKIKNTKSNENNQVKEKHVRVKLNEKGWKIYKEKNGFASDNIDGEGYSLFSYDYFEELFFPLPYDEFATDVKNV